MNHQPEVVDMVRAVHAARLAHQSALAQLTVKKAEFEAENAELIAKVSEHNQVVLDYEEQLRELAQRFRPEIAELREDPEKRWVGPGVEIKVVTEVMYDETAAVRYAIEHKLLAALAIKKREFDKIVRVLGPDVGVQVQEMAKVYLATDLGKALDALEETAGAPVG